jgi:SWI/SNF-related matrix-associated actin-dependent regulator 1 of chromatin subfamily A
VQTYYAGKGDRPQLRESLLNTQLCKSGGNDGWEVLITTYTLAQGDERDRKFFKKVNWNVSEIVSILFTTADSG